MKFIIAIAACMASMLSQAAPVGIASGQPTGTNYPMIEDVRKACTNPTTEIRNVITSGSMDNIAAVYGDRNTQYGIAQLDALEYQKGLDPKMMDNIVAVFPFFSVEVHLVAKDGSPIKSLADLAGKRVIEGPEGSGTWVSVQVIKAVTGIKWTALNASQQKGFDMVMAGEADAEFIVAGKPIGMLEKATGFKLVPVNHSALDQFKLYNKTMIPSSSYPSLKASVSTYKVDNVLVTYGYKNQYQKEIGDLVTCIANKVPELQVNGHPKWRDVNPLDLERVQWPVHPAALKAIKRAGKK